VLATFGWFTESSKVLETDQSFDVLLDFFPCPLHNMENNNAFKDQLFEKLADGSLCRRQVNLASDREARRTVGRVEGEEGAAV